MAGRFASARARARLLRTSIAGQFASARGRARLLRTSIAGQFASARGRARLLRTSIAGQFASARGRARLLRGLMAVAGLVLLGTAVVAWRAAAEYDLRILTVDDVLFVYDDPESGCHHAINTARDPLSGPHRFRIGPFDRDRRIILVGYNDVGPNALVISVDNRRRLTGRRLFAVEQAQARVPLIQGGAFGYAVFDGDGPATLSASERARCNLLGVPHLKLSL